MSNVLLGIIGVILFIGLALAGAIYLGGKFQDSTELTKAAAISQSLSQTVHAFNLYTLQEGEPLQVGQWEFLRSKGYLNARPFDVQIRGEDGTVNPGPVSFMISSSLRAALLNEESTCIEFARSVGMQTDKVLKELPKPEDGVQAGCFKSTVAWGDGPAGTLIYFQRI